VQAAKITESPFKNEPALILEYCSKSMKERIRTVFKGVSAESFVHLTEVRFIFTPLVKKCCKVLFCTSHDARVQRKMSVLVEVK
jgi:hypothetical protein